MTCQHPLFESGESQALFQQYHPDTSSIPIMFQPIVDTFEHLILAHECITSGYRKEPGAASDAIEAARVRSRAIHAAARESPVRGARQGLYFVNLVPSSIDDPALDMSSTMEAILDSGMHAGKIVFEVAESDLARNPAHSHRIREYLGQRGFGFALSNAGVGAGAYSFQAVAEFAPDYINLDRRLAGNFDQPSCAPAISKLVRMAEKSGACVIAKGVDRVRMVENLWLLGVRFMQGHLFGEPASHIG
jgi:EAL domain-containing protein (putative c-di-GMP-specific phosphodiesterase class I)